MSRNKSFSNWLSAYGSAWVNGDPGAIVELFSPDALYYETPYDDPMVGREAIRQYWREGAEQNQKNITFSFEILSLKGNVGIAHWQASFDRTSSRNHVDLDGVLMVEFDHSGQCKLFREWWHYMETEAG